MRRLALLKSVSCRIPISGYNHQDKTISDDAFSLIIRSWPYFLGKKQLPCIKNLAFHFETGSFIQDIRGSFQNLLFMLIVYGVYFQSRTLWNRNVSADEGLDVTYAAFFPHIMSLISALVITMLVTSLAPYGHTKFINSAIWLIPCILLMY